MGAGWGLAPRAIVSGLLVRARMLLRGKERERGEVEGVKEGLVWE